MKKTLQLMALALAFAAPSMMAGTAHAASQDAAGVYGAHRVETAYYHNHHRYAHRSVKRVCHHHRCHRVVRYY